MTTVVGHTGLHGVVTVLREAVDSEDALVAGLLGHLLGDEAGLLRPRLVLATASACGSDATAALVRAAAALELLHVASLYHDDVIDDADERRGTTAVHRRWGVPLAILGGDVLVARALSMAATCPAPAGSILLRAYSELCRGQLLESIRVGDPARSEAQYFAAVSGKAGALFEAAARLGGSLAGAGPADVDRLGAFGSHLGIAYQVTDDLLDLTAGAPSSLAGDVAQGVYSLPVILAVAARPELAAELDPGRPASPALVEAVTADQVLDATARAARDHLDAAEAVLHAIPVLTPARLEPYVGRVRDRLHLAAAGHRR